MAAVNASAFAYLTAQNWTPWEVREATENDDVLFFENFDRDFWLNFQNNYWWLFWVLTAIYWVATYSIRKYMKNREPLEIEGFMVVYNSLVALFSMIALWRLSTTFFPLLSGPDPFYTTVCTRFDVTKKEGFWLLAFSFSKLAHFMDTIFTVLRKRPVQFSQMYHHSIVVLIPQHILPYGEPILIWWGIVNVAQHALTYPYFALKALKVKVPKFASTTIVIVEILQMLIGLGTGLYSLHVLNSGGHCVRHPKSIKLMYFVYITMTLVALQMAHRHFRGNKQDINVKHTTAQHNKLKSN